MEIIKINEKDNVAVALEALVPGQEVKTDDDGIRIKEQIQQGHKVALCPLRPGDAVVKYGSPIGKASHAIEAGDWVHSHNLTSGLKQDDSYCYKPVEPFGSSEGFTGVFHGYTRSNGEIGIRNELWIIPTVGCVNGIGRKLAQEGERLAQGRIDGVHCFEHPYGCSQLGDDLENTKKILLGLCRHANAGGVLLLGLGCENLNLEILDAEIKQIQGKEIRTLNCQGVKDEVEEGMRLIRELVDKMALCKRVEQPLSKLKIGVKCGGSDGFSGITGNPLVGRTVETLTAVGASALMSEVPEMFGAETIIMNRCKNRQVFAKLVRLIGNFKDYYTRHQQPVYENPSPGNKAGGITTLEEKSLGCIQKGGTVTVEDVWEYGEQVYKSGLNLVDGPGNDLVSTTALIAAGAQMILFTTGRGTPLGTPVPTIKIATNTELAKRKPGWIDFNAGALLHGAAMEASKENLIRLICKVASGEKQTHSEKNGIREFAIFKNGVTL